MGIVAANLLLKSNMPKKDKDNEDSEDVVHLNEVAPSDLEEVARFIVRVSKSQSPIGSAIARLSWILLENPARESGQPLGWLLRASSGEVVGCMFCAPQKFCLGQTAFTVMMANSFYVDNRYRGGGASIFLKFLQLSRRYPLLVSSANPTVAEMWRKLGGYSIGHSDYELFGVLRWPPLLAETVFRRLASDGPARLAAAAASFLMRPRLRLHPNAPTGQLVPLTSADDAADICREHHSAGITNCRDSSFLKWRYLSGSSPNTRLYAFRERNMQFVIGACLQNRGYRQQIRALHVLDIWGEPDPESCLAIAASLWAEYREQIDMLVFRCLGPAQHRVLMNAGFRVRRFAAPIAWCIDKHGLLPGRNWYFAPADGDMFL
jgi:hypothetical protein